MLHKKRRFQDENELVGSRVDPLRPVSANRPFHWDIVAPAFWWAVALPL